MVVFKLNVSFVLALLGFKKKNALHLKFDMNTPTLKISSERYSCLEGIGMFFSEVLKLICSMFLTLRVLNSKSNINKLARAMVFRVNITVCINNKRVLYQGSLSYSC